MLRLDWWPYRRHTYRLRPAPRALPEHARPVVQLLPRVVVELPLPAARVDEPSPSPSAPSDEPAPPPPAPEPPPAPLEVRPLEPLLIPAGIAWCDWFPGSTRLEDLVDPFRGCVLRFVAHLFQLGYHVEITSTRRPEPRAFLMRFAWDIAHGLVALDDVPVREDIPISWTPEGALEMVRGFQLRYRPAWPHSRHIDGRAIDMTVPDWMGTDTDLHNLGRSFGVNPLEGDPVHWSDDGH